MKRTIYLVLLVSTASFSTAPLLAATLLVTNLLDDGSPGSLRETIANASSGDTIKFSVAGTILLDEALGELLVDTQLTIDGQYKIAVDGANLINVGFHITGTSASNTIMQNITIQNFNGHAVGPGSGTELQELPAYGILIDNNADNCSVIATTITHIHSGIDQPARGIFVPVQAPQLQVVTMSDNAIMSISSEDNPAGDSGAVSGIFADVFVTEDCTNNTIYSLTSGTAGGAGSDSGSLSAIAIASGAGDCSHNTIYNLTTGAAGRDSGSIDGILLGFITNCSHNTMYNLTTGAASNNSGSIRGTNIARILNNCSFNTLYHFTSASLANFSGSIVGIRVTVDIGGDCLHNTLYGFTSGNALSSSRSIFGIQVFVNIDGNCSFNTLSTLRSGDAATSSGQIIAIDVRFINGICSNNTITQLVAGNASSGTQAVLGIFVDVAREHVLNNRITDLVVSNGSPSLLAGGILLEQFDTNKLVACNTVARVTGGDGSQTFGIQIEEGDAITVRDNTIDTITGTNGPAHGILLADTAGVTFVTNALVSFNTIHTIIGSAQNGFGISIIQPGSVGNDLLNNRIFAINGKAINITDNGVPVDGVVTLQSAVCGKRKLFIQGSLQPALALEQSDFLLQFFASTHNAPPQAMTFLGEQIISAEGSGTENSIPFLVELKSCIPVFAHQYITATATALPGTQPNNNTSEVSNSIPGCTNLDPLCDIATTTCNLEPPPCPILIAQ